MTYKINEELKDYMFEFIEDICEKIGPRASGSEPERKAGDKIEEIFKEFCDETKQEEFTLSPRAFLGCIRFDVILIMIGVLIYWISLLIDLGYIPLDYNVHLIIMLIGMIIVLFASITLILEVVRYKEAIDFLFPKKKSNNIIGIINPKEEVKNTIIFSGHHDSAFEFNFFKWFKTWGVVLIFIGLVLVFIITVFTSLKFLFLLLSIELPIFQRQGIMFFFYLPIAVLFLFFIKKSAVQGAFDNLTAVAIILGIGKYLSDHRNDKNIFPKHTRVKLISFGSEEAGLRGSKRYVQAHLDELKTNQPIIINMDSVAKKDKIVFVKNEPFTSTKHDKELNDKLRSIAQDLNIKSKTGPVPFGGTDAVHFTKNNIRATSILGFPLTFKLPYYYHTSKDTPEVVEKDALGQVVEICLNYLMYLDNLK